MKTNFDFLKDVDTSLFEIIKDAQKLFQDEYFNQCVIQLRIFCETIAKKILGSSANEMTFDDMINCLKDKVKSDVEKEFIEDLFFIKREGNKCAHGETIEASTALNAIERAFEAAISYSRYKKNSLEFDRLQFDRTLLITGKENKEEKLIDKYLKRANEQKEEFKKEELLNSKQGEFQNKTKDEKDQNGFKDKNHVVDVIQYKKENKDSKKRGRKKKEFSEKELEIKEKRKAAKQNLKENVNNVKKDKVQKKPKNNSRKNSKKDDLNLNFIGAVFFVLFLLLSIFLLSKIIFVF